MIEIRISRQLVSRLLGFNRSRPCAVFICPVYFIVKNNCQKDSKTYFIFSYIKVAANNSLKGSICEKMTQTIKCNNYETFDILFVILLNELAPLAVNNAGVKMHVTFLRSRTVIGIRTLKLGGGAKLHCCLNNALGCSPKLIQFEIWDCNQKRVLVSLVIECYDKNVA